MMPSASSLSHLAMTFGPNAVETRARYRRCFGPSIPSMMCSPMTGPMMRSMMCPEQNVSESQHLGHVVVAVDEEDGGRFLMGHERSVDPLDRVLTPRRELGIRVTGVAGYGVVEEAELFAVGVAPRGGSRPPLPHLDLTPRSP